ncbi:hypothetical protein [Bacillus infantis]|uniref:hypothetical protein n=1 Tax=Bacillus infantis TaxID=324767 RepID=UPI002155183A|nr:hypothetical protein [Bacillus infantis]MCR6612940.1 hypothetical protein [Bacillus infantis]
MRIQMNGRNQVERQVRWSDVFDYVEGLLLYLLLKSAAMLKDVMPFGEIVLNMGQLSVLFIYCGEAYGFTT